MSWQLMKMATLFGSQGAYIMAGHRFYDFAKEADDEARRRLQPETQRLLRFTMSETGQIFSTEWSCLGRSVQMTLDTPLAFRLSGTLVSDASRMKMDDAGKEAVVSAIMQLENPPD